MRLLPTLTTAFVLASFCAHAQECLKLKEGQKITMVSYRYPNDQVFMPSWAKMKDSKRDDAVAAFNAKIASGELKGTPGTYVSDVKTVSIEPGVERAGTIMELGGKQYPSVFACINDTMYFTRAVGINYAIDAKGDTVGFGMLGVQAIPNKLKVGDKLRPYEDIGMNFPVTYTRTEKQNVLVGVETTTRTENAVDWDFNVSKFPVSGVRTIRETKDIYKTVDVTVRETLQFSANTINYAVAEVTGEDEVTVDGTKYKAFRIDSESWTKGSINKSYETNNQDWENGRLVLDARTRAAMDKRGIKKGYTNPLGYVVTYRTEWFVPGLGVTKMDIYDNYGFILSHSELASIK